MRRTKLSDRILPTYTKGEEIFNMISHIVGGALGIVVTTLCVIFAAIHNNVYGVVSGAIYGATVIILYTISSIYHGLSPKRMSKKVFQVLDHCSIFLLIAGTYTPVALCNIRSINPFYGWLIFGVVWGAAALGILLNAIDLFTRLNNVVGADIVELSPHYDASGASTAVACKTLREMILLLHKQH